VVATKFGHRFHPEAMQQARWSPVAVRSDHWTPTEVIAQLEASLRALRSDHVDIYQFHSGPDKAFDQDGLATVIPQRGWPARSSSVHIEHAVAEAVTRS
jgi:aryl-alcohol dehydrogenase-like predicted oxidoreductase